MLSVGGSGGRSRSKSPGRRDDRDRSRSRDMRAPSPAARRGVSPAVAPAPVSKPRKYYEEEEEDDDLVSDSEDRRRGGGYSRGAERDPRGGYDDEDEEEDDYRDKHRQSSGRYAEPDHRYATEEEIRAKTYRRDDPRREEPRNKEYAIPGQFDDDEDDRQHHKERPNAQPRSSSYTMGKTPYEKLPQFQYAAVDPKEVRYVQNGKTQYSRTPSDGPVYTRNPDAQVTVASSRHARKPSYDDRDRGDKYSKDDRRTSRMSQRDIERLEREQSELQRLEEHRRQLDKLKREKEEREERELKQKRPKSVQIRDDRDRERDRDRDYHEIRPKHDRKHSNYSDDEEDHERRPSDRYAVETYDRRRDDTRRRHEDEDSDDSDQGGRLDKLYHAKYREDDRYDDRHDDRRDNRRQQDKLRDRPDNRRRESEEKRNKAHQVVEIHPGGGRGALMPASPGLNDKTHRLSVSGQRPGALSLAAPGSGNHVRRGSSGAPPGSPLLESYRGTYQSISPMPSPMALAHHEDDSDLSDLDLQVARRKPRRRSDEDSDSSEEETLRREPKPKSILKRAQEMGVSAYDPEHDATTLARELKGSSPAPEVIIKIIPTLSDGSIALLRTEYKKHAKIQGKGINIAKHIKLKVSGNLGKAAYSCALGRWESEAHWANFWYQSGSSRRELLIECLFGRSNAEIRAIKDAFTDKRYGDSLVKCMDSELKKDKFRVAVLKALEAKRDEHPEPNMKLVDKDVNDLHKALTSKDGGETAMLNIIVTRGDDHLRTMLQEYEQVYRTNFAREMVKRSQNLVGETLAHILNGVINRPVRDALLLRQAIAETSKDRAELIISRLVRLHWEPKHLARVKVEYAKRYRSELEYDIEEGTKGDFSGFCVALCRGAIR